MPSERPLSLFCHPGMGVGRNGMGQLQQHSMHLSQPVSSVSHHRPGGLHSAMSMSIASSLTQGNGIHGVGGGAALYFLPPLYASGAWAAQEERAKSKQGCPLITIPTVPCSAGNSNNASCHGAGSAKAALEGMATSEAFPASAPARLDLLGNADILNSMLAQV